MDIEGLTIRTRNQLKRLFWAFDLGELNIETLRRELEKGFPVKKLGDASISEIEELTGYTLDFVGDVLLDPLKIGAVSRYRILKKVEMRKDRQQRLDTFILKWFEEGFGRPCEYNFNGEAAVDVIDPDGDYCQGMCGQPIDRCWRRYFEQLRGIRNGKTKV